jgi:cytoskeletal protein RodZ
MTELESIGQTLREARERKDVSESEAAAATRIKVQHIQALEHNEFDAIAAPIYVKGFLKLYAEYLGIDPNPLVDAYTRDHAPRKRPPLVATAPPQPVDLPEPPPEPETPKPAPRRPRLDTGRLRKVVLIAGALLVILLVLSALRGCIGRAARRARGREERDREQWELIESLPEPYLDAEGHRTE